MGWLETFEGDTADSCAKKCMLMSMGGRAKGLALRRVNFVDNGFIQKRRLYVKNPEKIAERSEHPDLHYFCTNKNLCAAPGPN